MKYSSLNVMMVLTLSLLASSCLVGKSNVKNLNNDSGDACISSIASGAGVVTTKISGSTSAPYGFLEYKPNGYSASLASYPVIVFLHGAGELGTDLVANTLKSKMSSHGPFRRINEGRHFPALVFAPQTSVWWNSNTLKTFLDWIEANYRVDRSRIYLTGLSMGGGGTWDFMKYEPSRIAGAIPICGASGANNSLAEKEALKAVPHIAVHNVDDTTVGYGNTTSFANSLGASLGQTNTVLSGYVNGTDVTSHFDNSLNQWIVSPGSREYKDAAGEFYKPSYIYAFDASGGHDSWTETYAKEETWEWLFCQQKNR